MQSEIFYSDSTKREFFVKFTSESQFSGFDLFKRQNTNRFQNVKFLKPVDAQDFILSDLKNFKCYGNLDLRSHIPVVSQQVSIKDKTPTFYDLIIHLDQAFKQFQTHIQNTQEKDNQDIWLLQYEKPVMFFYVQKKKQNYQQQQLGLYLIAALNQKDQ